MGGKKEIYRDVWFFHGAIQLKTFLANNTTRYSGQTWKW